MEIGIITGASSGMGRLFAKKAAAESLDEIWLIARRRERMRSLAKKYPDRKFRLLSLDLCNDQDLDSLSALLEKENARVKIFVHSAGMGKMGKIRDISTSDLAATIDLNCKSLAVVNSILYPFYSEDARLIFMVSAAAFLPQPGFSAYAASKAFALSYVRAFRAEERHTRKKITAVCPGAVKTEFLQKALGDGKLPFYKRLVLAPPDRVVDKAWRDNEANKEISVYGWGIHLTEVAAKILPHRVFLHFMGGKK